MVKKLSWEPIRTGSVYCSPACGADCLFNDFTRATESARLLADGLGSGWKPRVWENMGWFWAAVKGSASVRKYGKNYSADVHIGGRQFFGNASTPRRAFALAMEAASAAAQSIKKDIDSLEAA